MTTAKRKPVPGPRVWGETFRQLDGPAESAVKALAGVA